MFIAANVIVVLLLGLIAYWWANQGLFSAILHLLCVIVAGAVALAFWEPIVIGLLLRGGGFDDYAWGIVLVVVFALTLFVLRLAMDKLVPANVRVPHWANLVFGGAAGVASGTIALGIFLIGAGHVQSTNMLLGGVRGYARDANKSSQVGPVDNLWVPVHMITDKFYSLLSVTSLRSSRPLRHYAPDLYQQATLLRDSYGGGRGKLSMTPDAVTVERLYFAQTAGGERYFVHVRFGLPANDYGEQLTVSSAQIRLVGSASGMAKPDVVHPVAWRQHSGYHRFDDNSHYISSEPGKETTEAVIEFETDPGFVPKFIQIRGMRFDLPGEAQPAPARLLARSGGGGGGGGRPAPVSGQLIQPRVRVSSEIRPISVSKNMLPSSIKEVDNLLTTGEATFNRGGRSGSSALRIQGIFEPTGTRCVRVDVSRGGEADLFAFRDQAGEGATIALVDSLGNEYSAVGFFYKHNEGTTIKLEPTRRLRTIDDIPSLPSSGTNELELIFYVTKGATVTGLRFGDIDIGYCDVLVDPD